MRSGKALKLKKVVAKKKVAKKKTVAKKKAPAKKKAVAVAKPKAAAPAKVVTRTVTTDRNEKLRGLAQRIIDVTVANDEAGMFALYDPAIESQEANNPPVRGLEGLRAKFAQWGEMVSDGAFLPRSVAADGKTIVIEWDGRVTLRTSGRLVELREIAVHEIEGGRIVRERFYYDPSALQP
jgi:ketosteroid isomerase-like protein